MPTRRPKLTKELHFYHHSIIIRIMESEYYAGYILQGVRDSIKNNPNNELWTEVAKKLSAFYLSNTNLNSNEPEREHPILTILDNQISRGLPTIPTVFIEDKFSELLQLTGKKVSRIGNVTYDFKAELTQSAFEYLRALAIVDTRLTETSKHISFQTWEEHSGSDFEKRFYNDTFNQMFGNCNNQMLELQRSINSILEQTERDEQATRNILSNLSTRFFAQKTDFVLQFPEVSNFPKGLIIEIDGSQHQIDPSQIQLDNNRNHFTRQKNWEIVRITTKEFNAIPKDKKIRIENYLNHPFAKLMRKNISEPLLRTEAGRKFLQAMLSPFAIARIQKTVVKAFKKGLLDIAKEKVSIGIIERDVPCGCLAIKDLQNQIAKLSILQGVNFKLPLIDLKVFTTEEYKSCELNKGNNFVVFNHNENFENFDLLIDCSILSTKYFLDPPTNSILRRTVVIRSLHSTSGHRKFNFHPAITYPNLFEEDSSISESKKECLEFFLRSLFRKESFREKQIDILNKALQKKNPIALLPTGAGKSLTYQLASLLQPGLTIVVDPIKSLMKDQNENLINALIDATTYINSALTPMQRETNTRKFADGEFLFAFVSPERFTVKPFRRTLEQIANDDRKCFSFCVIDEAHCVSEWGHDFRTAYLKLGDNARDNCSTNNQHEKISIIGLTGTASFDVLSDVQREVNFTDELSIIRLERLEREELTFKVNVFNSQAGGATTDKAKRESVGSSTYQELINILNGDLLDEFQAQTFSEFVEPNGEYTNCGIIFCPHKTGNFGVITIAELLRNSFPDIREAIGEYYGGGDSGDKILEENQDKFKNNQISVLVATKAFGMGIDKPNVRFTIHLTHPISIEGFYQEAGRAGRDREKAVCYILHSKNIRLRNGNSIAKEIQESFLRNSFRGPENEKSIIFELLEQVTFPHTPNINQITNRIFNETRNLCKLRLFPNNQPHTIYVNGEEFGQKYGSISINNLQANPSDEVVTITEAIDVLEHIKGILESRPHNITVVNWLQSINETEATPGIETLLNAIPINQEEIITIGFENNGIQEISDYLSNHSRVFDYSLVLNALNFCFTFDTFISNLRTGYWHATNENFSFDQQILTELKPFYENIRIDQDTFKAVYRLSILGVVKDYIINYGAATINLTCQKLSDQQILDNLVKYVNRYVTTIAAASVREDAVNRNQPSMLRKCIDYLIDFTYEHIYQKRKIAMDNMEKAIQSAVTDGNEGFRTEVNNYFDSRYVEELRMQTQNGNLLDYTILFNFINKVGNNKDEIKQLRSSSSRLLESYQTNALFYWMRLYSSLLLIDRDFTTIQSDFRKGLEYFENKYDLSVIDEIIKQLKDEIKNRDYESLNTFDNIINSELTDIAIERVKIINQKILDNYVIPRT